MLVAENVDENFIATNIGITEKEGTMGDQEEERPVASVSIIKETENASLPLEGIPLDIQCGSVEKEKVNCEDMTPSFDKEQTNVVGSDFPPASKVLVSQKSSYHENVIKAKSSRRQQRKSLEHDKIIDALKEKHQSKGDRKIIDMRWKSGQNVDSDLHIKQRKRSSNSASPKVCFT